MACFCSYWRCQLNLIKIRWKIYVRNFLNDFHEDECVEQRKLHKYMSTEMKSICLEVISITDNWHILFLMKKNYTIFVCRKSVEIERHFEKIESYNLFLILQNCYIYFIFASKDLQIRKLNQQIAYQML